ncbi:MAG: WbqC family protein [Bacteroidales bacterium]|nr:WbqC family protein [Bacteroidales bacterium]
MVNKTILFSSAYLPPIDYFRQLASGNEHFIEAHETYAKQSYRNRCYIYSANGKLPLIIPVIKVNGAQTKTKDIAISYSEKWQTNHWRAITSAYNSSPFFLYYQDDFKLFYQQNIPLLIDFNQMLLTKILEMTGITAAISFTESYIKTPINLIDQRIVFDPKRETPFPCKPYIQVFSNKSGFIPGLSIIDLLFNLGPETRSYLTITEEK